MSRAARLTAIAEAHERAPHHVPVGAAAQATVRDPDLDLASGGRALELEDLERRCGRARRVVLVRERRAEDRVEVGALVAERELQEVAAVGRRRRAATRRTKSSSFAIASSSES